ncbi:MAG: hypothetical protein ACI85Q_001847 [Salibacteraceae bacterium]|jgi:hypothetical protein
MIDQLSYPVLLIPEKSEEISINRIVLTTDFGIDDTKTIQYLLDWAAAFEAQLYVLHVSATSSDRMIAESGLQKWGRYFEREVGEGSLSFYVTDKEKGGIIFSVILK